MNENEDHELSARAVYRRSLRRLRAQRGWALSELSSRTNYDASYLQRLEKGARLGTLEAAQTLDGVYDSGDLHTDLWRLSKREAGGRHFGGFAEAEAAATGIHEFSVGAVPGLLQTPGYAETLMRMERPASEEILAQQVQARMARQERLTGAGAVYYRGLLDESVIRRPVRDPQVWADQLERLVQAAQEPNIALQIVPLNIGPHPLLEGSARILWLASGRTVAYVESSWSGQVVSEIEDVERLRLAYDLLRDSALSTADSLALLRTTLEDHSSCLTPPRT